MAGVNDWRFRLAEEEDRRRRKLGWDDLLGLLQTAAGIGTSIAGLKQSGERQALAQEQFDYGKGQDVLDAERQVGLDARAQEQHETGMHDKGYFQPAPAMQGPMPATAQTTSTGMTRLPEYDEAREFRQGLDQAQQISEAAEARGGAPGQVFGGDQWHYPPGYGQAAGGGDYDPLDAQRLEVMTEQEMMRRYPDAPRGMDGELMYTDEMRAERATVMDGFKTQFGYDVTEPEDDLSTGGALWEFAQGYAAQKPEALADFAAADPKTQAAVLVLSQNLGASGSEQVAAPDAPLTRGSDLTNLLEMVAGETAQAGELMTGKLSEIEDLDAETQKWQGALAELEGVPYSGARAQREQQIRAILSAITAERERRLIEAREMGVQNRRPTPLGGMGGLGGLR